MNISDMKLTPEEYRWVDDWLQMWGSWVYSGRLEKRMSSVIAKFMEAADPTRIMPTRPMCNDDDGLLISQVVDRVIASVDKRALGVLLSYYAHGSSKYGIASYYHKTANPRKVESKRGGVRMRPPSLITCRREVDQILESSLWMIYQSLYPTMKDKEKESFSKKMRAFKDRGRVYPSRKLIYGVGVNDADYYVTEVVNGKTRVCPAYRTWYSMLNRCYGPKAAKEKPTYTPVIVCNEWHSFMAFRRWWAENYVDGWQIDKDIIVPGNQEYAPDRCLFVPPWLNSFTVDHAAASGEWSLGVCMKKDMDRLVSHCCNPATGKREFLGYFHSDDDAHRAWLNRKLEIASEMKDRMDSIDHRVYPSIVAIIKRKSHKLMRSNKQSEIISTTGLTSVST